jgi:hypothetical protein
MAPSPSTSVHDGIGCPPPITGKQCGTDSTPGRRSRAFPPPPKHDEPGGRAPSCSLSLSTGNKLTTPWEALALRPPIAGEVS